jgi:hemoglobin/transferrin/lactoferrin receptor protein
MTTISGLGLAQTVSILEQTTLQPIVEAQISAPGILPLFTDNKGKADIRHFSNTTEIKISHVGYETITTNFQLLAKMKFIVYMTERSQNLNDIVVSATRFEEKQSDVPQKIEVLKSKDLSFMNQSSTADVLQNSGQVFVQKSQMGGGSPIMRGFEANRVLIVVDGIRINNAIYRGGHLQNVISIDNNMLDRVELLFGPGSVIYGSDALGGVMHFYTKNPILSTDSGIVRKVNAFARYANATGEKTSHINVSFGSNKWGYLTGLTLTGFSNLRTGRKRDPRYPDWGKRTFYVDRIDNRDTVIDAESVNDQNPSKYNQFDLIQKVVFTPNNKNKHLLNLQYSTTTNIPRYDRLTQIKNGTPRFAEWYYGPQKRFLSAYTFERKSNSKLMDQMRIITAYQKVEESRNDRSFGDSILNQRVEKVDIFTINADFERRIKKHEFSYGVDGFLNKVNSSAQTININNNKTGPLDTRYPDGGSTFWSLAAFATHKYEFNPKWIFSDGIRYSNFYLKSKFIDTTFFAFPFKSLNQKYHAVNGNLGLVYAPYKFWKLGMVASSGFRAPNVDDIGKVFESVAGNLVIPNPNLQPEYTYNIELGMTRAFHDNSMISLSAFHTWFLNAMTTGRGRLNGQDSVFYNGVTSAITTTINAGKSYLYGFNGRLFIVVTENLTFTTDLSYTFGRIKTDSTAYPLDHIPPVYGKSSFMWKQKRLKAEVYTVFNGWKTLKNYNMIGEDNFAFATPDGTPAWMTLNFRAGYQAGKGLQLQMGVENIFDRHYRVFASGISAPGRSFFLAVKGNI